MFLYEDKVQHGVGSDLDSAYDADPDRSGCNCAMLFLPDGTFKIRMKILIRLSL